MASKKPFEHFSPQSQGQQIKMNEVESFNFIDEKKQKKRKKKKEDEHILAVQTNRNSTISRYEYEWIRRS